MLSLQRVFVVLWICSRSIVLVELPVFSFFIVVAGHLLLLTWLNSHFFLLSLSLPRFAWVSIALFNYWFIAILLAEVIQCQLRRLLQGPVPSEMRCSTAFCTAIQLLFNCCFDVSPDELAYKCTVPCRMPSSSILCSSPTRFAQSWVALSCLRLLIKNLISSLNFENSLALTKSIACFCGSSCKSVCWVLDNASVMIRKCSKIAHNVLKAQLST